MTVLLESPAAVLALGFLVITLGAIPFAQTRSRGALALLAAAVLLATGGFVGERLYRTPREEVERDLDALFRAIRANDLPGVLACIDPRDVAGVRSDAEALMPRFRVEAASQGGDPRVELPDDPSAEGALATARLKPLIRVQHRRSGAVGAYFDRLELQLIRRDGRWLVSGYSAAKDWQEGAAKLGR